MGAVRGVVHGVGCGGDRVRRVFWRVARGLWGLGSGAGCVVCVVRCAVCVMAYEVRGVGRVACRVREVLSGVWCKAS